MRRSGLIGAVLVFLGLFGVGAGLGMLTGAPSTPSPRSAQATPIGPAARAIGRSTPVRISIPSINVYAPVMSVGLAANGAIDAPPLADNNLAGWYSGGPSPGQMGPAIVVGHVDGPAGESVFYHLGRLRPGAKITVDLANHHAAMFTVYSVEYYSKVNFPGQRVYGDYSRPGLRLITCGGKYVGGSIGYTDNIVVYASMTLRG